MYFSTTTGGAMSLGGKANLQESGGTIIRAEPGFKKTAGGAAGTPSSELRADLVYPESATAFFRLGGTLQLSMGLAVRIDVAEFAMNSGTAGTAMRAGEPFGRQVVITTGAVAVNSSFTLFAGIYTGKTDRFRGGNMPTTTPTLAEATASAPTNGFTYVGGSGVAAIDPINGGNSFALPGDLLEVRWMGPAYAWCNDTGAAISVGDSVSNICTVAPTDGTLSGSLLAGRPIATSMANPGVHVAAGTSMACMVYLR